MSQISRNYMFSETFRLTIRYFIFLAVFVRYVALNSLAVVWETPLTVSVT